MAKRQMKHARLMLAKYTRWSTQCALAGQHWQAKYFARIAKYWDGVVRAK